ncbi:MAG: aldehyde dehydrogenase family protein, partial [Solirubrobacteraceae bacterium]
MRPFTNEPTLELRRAAARATLVEGMEWLDRRLPIAVPVWIGDERGAAEGLDSTDPAEPERVVATAGPASRADVDRAVEVASRSAWSHTSATERAEVLTRAAAWLRERRAKVAALAVRECAKPWGEADADVCEAIDFLEFYAREAVELERGPELLQAPGERNAMAWRPRGVTAVISPWNFPVAIACGMTAAALATGNPAILKPAEQSPGCAFVLVEGLREAGVPPDALALLPGEGDTGAALVEHPGVHTIAFTGSAAVGLEILRKAADVPDGQRHLKRVVAEMGGKNCVIVDSDADLDEVVPAIVKSAFVYAGQKCSAAARVLAHEAVADLLLERLAGAVEVLRVGQADTFGIDVPPVIDDEAQSRVLEYIEIARRDGRIAAQRPLGARPGGASAGGASAPGHFCPPTLATDLPPESPVIRDEIFGPVLAVERFKSVEAACDAIEASPFALTGGLFSRSPGTIEYVIGRS